MDEVLDHAAFGRIVRPGRPGQRQQHEHDRAEQSHASPPANPGFKAGGRGPGPRRSTLLYHEIVVSGWPEDVAVTSRANGYDATILIDICKAILDAKAGGKLSGGRYDKMIEQAQIIMSASAKNGIRELVYALAGYNPSAEEVIAAFKLYVQEEAKKYEPEFPSELYAEWYRLYSIPVLSRGKPWHFKYLTVNHIYHPLAQSNGQIYELLKALKAKGGDQKTKLFQFLNKIGARALRIQLGRILEMAESSPDKDTYEQKIVDRFGGQKEFQFIIPPPSAQKEAAN